MKRCKECDRVLEGDNETEFCPACNSHKSYVRKKIFEGVVSVVAVVVGIVAIFKNSDE